MLAARYPDVLILDRDPAGTTVGTLLMRKVFSVTLLEKEQHLRFRIGESLLPIVV